MYEIIILKILLNPITDLILSVLFGGFVYIAIRNKMSAEKAYLTAYFSGVATFAIIMSGLGIIILDNSNVPLTNLTKLQIMSMNHDIGIFFYSTGFAVLVFSVGILLNILLGYKADKKIDAIYQYVMEKQKSAEKEEMEKSCRLQILKKLTTRRR